MVPFLPAGSVDATSRGLAQKLAEQLRQPVIVDNRPALAAISAWDAVAKAAPDGYTIGMGALSTHRGQSGFVPEDAHDAVKDFAPVSLVVVTPNVLVTNSAAGKRHGGHHRCRLKDERQKSTGQRQQRQRRTSRLQLFRLATGAPVTTYPTGGGLAMTRSACGRCR